MARSEVEEVVLLLMFLVLIALSFAVMISLGSNFLTAIQGFAKKVMNFVFQVV